MNNKQKSLLNNSLDVFNKIRASMNQERTGKVFFEVRGKMRYNLSPNTNKVTISQYSKEIALQMEELLQLDDSEWKEALGENVDVTVEKAKLITMINVIRELKRQRKYDGETEPIPGGEEFYKEPEQQQEPPKDEPPKDEPQDKVVYRFGVKKEVLNAKIDTYQRIIDQKGHVVRSNSSKVNPKSKEIDKELLGFYKELADKKAKLVELKNDKTNKNRSQDIAKIQKSIEETEIRKEKLIKQYGDVLDYTFIVDELKHLIESSKFETFVEMDSIQKQMEFYKNLLDGTDINKGELETRKQKLSEELDQDKQEETKLKEKINAAAQPKELTLEDKAAMLKYLKALRDSKSKNLETNKANHYKEMLSILNKKISELEQEKGVKDEATKLEAIDNRQMTAAEKAETISLLESIRKEISTSPSKGKVGGKNGLADSDLKTEAERIKQIEAKVPEDVSKLQEELDSLMTRINNKQKELEEIDRKLQLQKQVPEHEKEMQKRSAEARLRELRKLSKDRELFKITASGEVVINYPERKLTDEQKKAIGSSTVDEVAEQAEHANDLMVKEFYGHRETKTEFDEIMDRLMDPENRVMKKGTKYENGKPVEYEYEGIKEYEGRDEDLAKIKMSDYVLIFERVKRAEKGDFSDYDMPNGEEQYKKDLEYLKYNNGKYDRVATTTKNLKTLGKYGEKVPYTERVEGQPVRNAFRGIGNALKFVRNHTTAPIYHFLGNKIVSPIYARIHKGQEGKSRGAFENKPLHRYLARREYFESQGKGFFSSRFNAIFNATKGNQALLNIGAGEIKSFYHDVSTRLYNQRIQEAETLLRLQAIDFRKKDIAEQITMLEEAVRTVQNPEDKAKYEQTLKEYQMAEEQIKRDEQAAQEKQKAKEHVSMDVNYDTIDMEQHDKANKDTITKTVAVIKGFARMGIRKFIGPKVKEWLLEKSKQEIETPVTTYEDRVTDRTYVPTTYKDEVVPIYEDQVSHNTSMSEIMAQNAGKKIEGYYSVYGGEARPQMYSLTGNEKITAVFQGSGTGGTGFSDVSGLSAPTLVDKTFNSSLLGTDGVLNQDITVEKFIEMIGAGKVNPETLEGMYVSVGDKYWAKLSDLYQGTVQQVEVGQGIQKVVDVEGHWEDVISKVPVTTMTKKVVENPRILKILKGLGIAGKGLYGASAVEDVYENTRRTDSDVPPLKTDVGEIEVEEIYTGKRKDDLAQATEEIIDEEQNKDDEEER